jgi:hypothetical protein
MRAARDCIPVEAGRPRYHDLLDAAAVAWTAARYVEGRASSYPEVHEDLGDALRATIWA